MSAFGPWANIFERLDATDRPLDNSKEFVPSLPWLPPRRPAARPLVVELNRAVAMPFGPAAGLELVDALTAEPRLRDYHLLPSVRGDLLARLGRSEEARVEFERAASLTRNARERELLLQRAAAAARLAGPPRLS